MLQIIINTSRARLCRKFKRYTSVHATKDDKGKGKLEEKIEGTGQGNDLIDIEALFNADQAKNNDLSSLGEPPELEQL